MELIYTILDWSEVWALLIPLVVLLKFKKQPGYLKPIIIYLWVALFIDLAIDIGFKYKHLNPYLIYPNNYLYNIHSILRFILFSNFFIALKQPSLVTLKKVIPLIILFLAILNFIFFEPFFSSVSFSSRLLATEAGVLLFYCLQYYLFKLQEEHVFQKTADYWMVTALSIYVVFNFPFFLLYSSLEVKFQVFWWNIHNVSFIIFCIFIAKAFYVSRNRY
ncbi:MAG: hypothetical protein ABIN36_04200 [Ferruginibacter sp.]